MVNLDGGEYIDHKLVKKKVILLKNDEELDIEKIIDDVRELFVEYRTERFDDLEQTLLPLARYATGSPMDIAGFIYGFLVGSMFEREGIKIKTKNLVISQIEKKQYNRLKLGYDFTSDYEDNKRSI